MAHYRVDCAWSVSKGHRKTITREVNAESPYAAHRQCYEHVRDELHGGEKVKHYSSKPVLVSERDHPNLPKPRVDQWSSWLTQAEEIPFG